MEDKLIITHIKSWVGIYKINNQCEQEERINIL